MARVRISAAARRDLKEIWKYIADDNVVAADELLDHIGSVLDLLGRSPMLGRSRDDLAVGLRSFAVGNYVVFYLPRRGGITAIRILSGYRDLNAVFE